MELLIKILTGIGFIVFVGVFICWLIPSVEELEERDKKETPPPKNDEGV